MDLAHHSSLQEAERSHGKLSFHAHAQFLLIAGEELIELKFGSAKAAILQHPLDVPSKGTAQRDP